MSNENFNVVWKPLKGSQSLALCCPCNHILYEGTRGPGKTDSQLMFFRRFVGIGYGQFWRGVIFDREYKNLDDLVAKSKRWFLAFGDNCKFLSSKGDYKWVWPTGEQLLFRQVKKKEDYYDYHGQEFPFIGWNELTKHPSSDLYEDMMSCNRSSFLPEEHSPDLKNPLPKIPLVVYSTTNPYGPGHNWVKRKFIDPAPPGKAVRVKTSVFNPQTGKREIVTKTQVRIFGSYKENRYLSPEYVADLENISDANKRRAWLWGDWDIVAGGAFDDLWNTAVHVLPRFKVPSGWRIDRSFDWGSTTPYSVGYYAMANGEEATLPDGTTFCPPSGSLIRIGEIYGTSELGTNKGLMESIPTVCEKIRIYEKALTKGGWISGPVNPGPADNQIYNRTTNDNNEIETLASRMAAFGIKWIRSDKSPGSRVSGLQLVRDMLENSTLGERPGLYITSNCRAALATLPVLPRSERNPEDVDTDAEDHVYDELRYRVLHAKKSLAKEIKLVTLY